MREAGTKYPAPSIPGGLAVLIILFSLAQGVNAHHSRAPYEIGRTIELQGVVSEVRWRNPHVYVTLDVSAPATHAGEWLMEGHSITGMLRNNWNQDTIKAGDTVTAVVNPSRDGSPSGLIDHFATATGENFYAFRTPPGEQAGSAAARARPSTDFSGVWTYRRPLGGVLVFAQPNFDAMPLTDAGRQVAEQFDFNDSPLLDCQSAGIPSLILGAYGFGWKRNNNAIIIEKEQSSRELTRTIYLDGRSMPEDFEPWVMGFSTGRFEEDGDVLVVETSGFSPTRWGITRGIDSSAEKRLTERYRLVNGGLRMIVEYTVEDSVYLTEPIHRIAVYDKEPDREFVWVPCDPETARLHMQSEQE